MPLPDERTARKPGSSRVLAVGYPLDLLRIASQKYLAVRPRASVSVSFAAAGRKMRQNDTQVAALFRGAVEHQLQGRSEEALKSYDVVIRLNPEMAAAHCNRGIVLLELGKVD